jgi:hypothetical protein
MSEHNKRNIRDTDRVLVLRVMDNKKPKSSTGVLDDRLFKGENNLHALKNLQTGLWSLKYEKGTTPINLQQQFTSFGMLMNFSTNYFKKRNVEIVEVID